MPISLSTIPRIWNPHRGIQNPRLSLNKLYMGREIEEKRRYFYENVTCRGTEKDAGRGSEVMEIEYFSSFAIFVTVLLSLVAIIAVPGNGLVLGIIVRFKKLRTFPNIYSDWQSGVDRLFQCTHERTYVHTLACCGCQMVYWKDFGDNVAFSMPPLHPP